MRGRCLCGQVEFEILGADPRLYQCHCSLCRKQSGSAASAGAIIAKENFRWLSGHDGISSWVADTGFRSHFCSNCGCPVPNPFSTAYFWVPAGLLDHAGPLEIAVHLFVGSKASWDMVSSSGIKFETMPELSRVLELLHAGADA